MFGLKIIMLKWSAQVDPDQREMCDTEFHRVSLACTLAS